jgi:hypothetical protein
MTKKIKNTPLFPSKRRKLVQHILNDVLPNYNPKAIVFGTLNPAIIGIGKQHGMNYVLVYDANLCKETLRQEFKKDNPSSSPEEIELMAEEWFSNNVECLYAGPNTPIILETIETLSL